MTDKAAISRLSLVLFFFTFKSSLMVRDVTGFCTSIMISDTKEWKLSPNSALAFKPSALITPGRTARILELTQNTNLILRSGLTWPWQFQRSSCSPNCGLQRTLANITFVEILENILSTCVYTNMAMVHRLRPTIGRTPVPSVSSSEVGTVVGWATAVRYTPPTQWICQRGMDQLQSRAVCFTDILLRSGERTMSMVHPFSWNSRGHVPKL